MSTNEDITPTEKDEILEIFFDENFVPQAYVDILLSTTRAQNKHQLQHTSSSLLARLDFYTKHLTSELEKTIWNLEKLSERLPGTWDSKSSRDQQPNSNEDQYMNSQIPGASKLEYYLDTLGGAVRSVENDVEKINKELETLDGKFNDDTDVIEKSKKLELVRSRLNNVLNIFLQLQSILGISQSTDSDSKQTIKNVSLENFTLALNTLEETITESLTESLKKESSKERNADLIAKVDQFIRLTQLFQGLTHFHDIYAKFSDNISRASQSYLATKDIDGDFNI
ncbi:similar to Saccharomyces cerevisiae YGL005C COG7 Component of the conserved oligomeric Golgi complex (Cog1p through Cog8p) [Maudiozyma saulgeensis]|uniref:Similar to Saccharomyces cerevisiae YGL005C COG7 Component of the conserved oligomeric Golgi complex (Cog1p through Cog8p) n=1 Tax=Maudiozyma saulgeensis TaxID=1789683 RepID=A0A1X7RA31_9SACH|nr:similar to Saccharomyces cerevisiae YGL005C COG7 Component of the conserved oligomeric Golgi complex (Cog1p through Cog8p) [Kazachstania saulgeensis]